MKGVPDLDSESFESLQAGLLADQAQSGKRAPGRARVNRIIGAAIELLQEHKPNDISIAMIAERGGMTRTSVYAHFASVDGIFEQISVRFMEQTGVYVERFVRERNPRSLEELVTMTIRAIQVYFNQTEPKSLEAPARHVPFEIRNIIKDFDKVAALPYHTLWQTGWPVEPLSDKDPFRVLVLLQSALFETSIQRYGKITDFYVDEAIDVAIDFVRRMEAKFDVTPKPKLNAADRITHAVGRLSKAGNETFLEAAAGQIEVLVSIVQKQQKQRKRATP